MFTILRTALVASVATLTIGAAAVAQTAPATDTAATSQPETVVAAAYAPQKVVYHISGKAGNDGKGYNGALANLRNHVAAVGADKLDLRVVMYGSGVDLLQLAVDDPGIGSTISELKAEGVKFLVCNNTLTAREIDPSTLFEVEAQDIVPSGVAELGKLQMEGFAYIKP